MVTKLDVSIGKSLKESKSVWGIGIVVDDIKMWMWLLL